ncbi:sulfurtransferase TusA family protein [Catenovulum sp. 2E275]|uniref:sulfurtransferase TusA family protein n=1 Tax=Catenovulum sp. 2E275 TaxID=2980497 RepID=UPI0021D3B1FE|nr:sulfurtransferase TusA family protein [Catenovulum sp. 2E275]MCU4676969.1 sulfurtransferase TusA family protein [Catenovulum sp. 2E275]
MQFNLDTRGLICPMPLLKLKMLLKQCQQGDSITQLITDPTSVKDIPAWLEKKGHKIQIKQEIDSVFVFHITIF